MRTELLARVTASALVVVGVVATWSGILVVDPAEVAVVTRFGAVNRTLGAGLGFRLPLIEADERIRVTEVRRIELPKIRLLTEDTNLVDLELIIQYSVADPVLYALVHAQPEQVISAEVTSAANARVADVPVDELLTTGRAALAQAVLVAAQTALDGLGTGVRLVALDVRNLVPPDVVVNAFNDVSSARGDQETTRLAADAYASKVLPDVRGRAAQVHERASAAATEQAARSDGDIARYRALLPTWRSDPASTRVMLREELWKQIGERVELQVVPTGSNVTIDSPAPFR